MGSGGIVPHALFQRTSWRYYWKAKSECWAGVWNERFLIQAAPPARRRLK
ncbi:hypothetical protein BACCAP_04682 [Pseudoflavonifractor capillosus ATCC 29799]|uniref:Uncharacterized protein n=1 Tax=Pseudoflavonifractor capillosus ATCC 29799 TaxID=411467 RepID=A6P2F1_9FIRM|nr:hypothetical protein BACCAP_04682 [Pseudoflavonifractor capillosus ATCC 29799]